MKKLATNVILLLGVVLICCLLGETLVRLIAPQHIIGKNKKVWQADEKLSIRHVENTRTMVGSGDGFSHFLTDKDGYRINSKPDSFDRGFDSDASILLIGDSFIEGVSVENEQTIPSVLGRLLHRQFGLTVHAINDGVSGWSPGQYYLEAQRSLARHNVQLGIVFLFVGNDLVSRIDTLFEPESLARRWTNVAWNKRILLYLRLYLIKTPALFFSERSQLFILLKQTLINYVAKKGKTMGDLQPEFLVEQKNSPVWEATTQTCLLTKQVFDQHHTPVFFVLLPPIWQVQEDLFWDYVKYLGLPDSIADLDQPNRLLAASFAEHSLHLVDPLNRMRDEADRGLTMYGQADRHFNSEGHRVVAEVILPTVEDYLKLHSK